MSAQRSIFPYVMGERIATCVGSSKTQGLLPESIEIDLKKVSQKFSNCTCVTSLFSFLTAHNVYPHLLSRTCSPNHVHISNRRISTETITKSTTSPIFMDEVRKYYTDTVDAYDGSKEKYWTNSERKTATV